MARQLKILVPILAGILATGAATASLAPAVNVKSEVSPTYLTGSAVGEQVLTFSGGTVKCKEAKLSEASNFVGKEVAALELETIESSCTAFGQKATVDRNGCKDRTDFISTIVGTMKFVCPAGQDIVITVGSPTVVCTITIQSQTPGTNTVDVTAGNVSGKEDFRINWTVGGITYTVNPAGAICGNSGTTGSRSGGLTVRGFSDLAHTNPINLTVI